MILSLDEQLRRAHEIVYEEFKDDLDKGGHRYLHHLYRVSEAGVNIKQKIVGLLHDLLEDKKERWNTVRLIEEGFSPDLVNSISYLTHKPGEPYNDYIDRILTDDIAISVKKNDLRDNMDITRLTTIDEDAVRRLNKYLKAWRRLTY